MIFVFRSLVARYVFFSTVYKVLKSQDHLELGLRRKRGIWKVHLFVPTFTNLTMSALVLEFSAVFLWKCFFQFFVSNINAFRKIYLTGGLHPSVFDTSFFSGGVFFITVCNFTISSFCSISFPPFREFVSFLMILQMKSDTKCIPQKMEFLSRKEGKSGKIHVLFVQSLFQKSANIYHALLEILS